MFQQITPFSAAQFLLGHELFSFDSRTFAEMFELNKYQATRLLDHMEQAGLVVRVQRGRFLLLGLTPEKVLSNPLHIGSFLAAPAYVSFWSALHFHGFTEQVPRMIFVATTRRKKNISFQGVHFQFVTIKPRHFFGYRREMLADLPVVIADEAKSILDSLALPHYAGGIAEVAKALQTAALTTRLEMDLLFDYAERLQNASLASRLGYLLEQLGLPFGPLQASKGPVKLDPQNPARGKLNRRWQLYVNIPRDVLFPQGVS